MAALESSRIRAETSKTQKPNLLSRGSHFEAFSAHRPKKTPIFEHFLHLQRRSLQIAAKSWFSSIFSSRLELSRIRAETSKTQKAHFLSRGNHFGALWAHGPKKAPIFEHVRHLQRKSLQIAAKNIFLTKLYVFIENLRRIQQFRNNFQENSDNFAAYFSVLSAFDLQKHGEFGNFAAAPSGFALIPLGRLGFRFRSFLGNFAAVPCGMRALPSGISECR